MSVRDRILKARHELVTVLASRRGRPHIDRDEAVDIAIETAEAVRAGIRFGAQIARVCAGGPLTPSELVALIPTAQALGVEVETLVALVEQAMED